MRMFLNDNDMDDERSVGERLAGYISDHSANLPVPGEIDYLLLTHFHRDHMGGLSAAVPGPHGYKLSGVTALGEYFRFRYIVDRGWPDYDWPSYDIVDRHAKGFMDDYRKFLKYQKSARGTCVEKFKIGSHRQFCLSHNPSHYDFDIWNIAANGFVSVGKGCRTKTMFGPDDDPSKFDENLFSCAVVFRYGPFKYYNGGDLCGNPDEEGTKLDFESQVADRCAPVTVINADHHGWKDSSNPYFLWKMRPAAVVIAASGPNQPRPETLRRLSDPHLGIKYIFASTPSASKICGDETKRLTAIGHTLVRVYENGQKWQIFVFDRKENNYRILYKTDLLNTD